MMAALKIGYVRKGGHCRSVNVLLQVVMMLQARRDSISEMSEMCEK